MGLFGADFSIEADSRHVVPQGEITAEPIIVSTPFIKDLLHVPGVRSYRCLLLTIPPTEQSGQLVLALSTPFHNLQLPRVVSTFVKTDIRSASTRECQPTALGSVTVGPGGGVCWIINAGSAIIHEFLHQTLTKTWHFREKMFAHTTALAWDPHIAGLWAVGSKLVLFAADFSPIQEFQAEFLSTKGPKFMAVNPWCNMYCIADQHPTGRERKGGSLHLFELPAFSSFGHLARKFQTRRLRHSAALGGLFIPAGACFSSHNRLAVISRTDAGILMYDLDHCERDPELLVNGVFRNPQQMAYHQATNCLVVADMDGFIGIYNLTTSAYTAVPVPGDYIRLPVGVAVLPGSENTVLITGLPSGNQHMQRREQATVTLDLTPYLA